MTTIKVGILGLGTVGGGTAKLLQSNAEVISRKLGCSVEVRLASVRDPDAERVCDAQGLKLTTDPFEVVNDKSLDIVVESIGGETIAKDLIMQAIENGKHIVTANKALIALHGSEVFAAAQKNNVSVMYEAAVAGGISIIKDIREGLAANKIEWLAGIINGTGNFILTEMRDTGRDFADVLGEAQALGYAEADPTFDVEGIDAAHKLTILASIAFGIPLSFEKVYTEGISKVNLTDVSYAGELGYQIKHLGIARQTEDGLELRVHPTLIPRKQLIAHVDGVMNAVMIKGDAVGSTLHYGAGAGSLPTASAIVADIIDIARAIKTQNINAVPHLGFQQAEITEQKIKSSVDFVCANYLRIDVIDVAGVMSKLSTVFADLEVSIEAIIQKEPEKGIDHVSVIFITQETLESRIDQAIMNIEAMESVTGEVIRVRLEHLD